MIDDKLCPRFGDTRNNLEIGFDVAEEGAEVSPLATNNGVLATLTSDGTGAVDGHDEEEDAESSGRKGCARPTRERRVAPVAQRARRQGDKATRGTRGSWAHLLARRQIVETKDARKYRRRHNTVPGSHHDLGGHAGST